MKPETEIRNLKQNVKILTATVDAMRAERDLFRSRATKAEQDAAEWRKRFDALLARVPLRSMDAPEKA